MGHDSAEHDTVGKLLNRTCRILCTVASLNRSRFPQDIVDVDTVDTTSCILIAKPTVRKPNFNLQEGSSENNSDKNTKQKVM